VSPVKYELGYYIPEDDILHSHGRENLKSYTAITVEITDVKASELQYSSQKILQNWSGGTIALVPGTFWRC
jgi:hypothetical protein